MDAHLVAPVSGDVLFDLEVKRRNELGRKGNVSTGCSEVDDMVLMDGGLERGCVVGVSAEEMDFGILVSWFFNFFFEGVVLRVCGICW